MCISYLFFKVPLWDTCVCTVACGSARQTTYTNQLPLVQFIQEMYLCWMLSHIYWKPCCISFVQQFMLMQSSYIKLNCASQVMIDLPFWTFRECIPPKGSAVKTVNNTDVYQSSLKLNWILNAKTHSILITESQMNLIWIWVLIAGMTKP